MGVKFLCCVLTVQLVLYGNGEKALKSTNQQTDDELPKTNTKNPSITKPLDLFSKHDTVDPKDYFLPPVFTSHEHEEDDDEEDPYPDYDYETKETNYKDSPDSTDLVPAKNSAVDDKIPFHSAKDNLPIFLLEPENTYVVKNKPAVLKCRAANALEVYFKCNGIKTQPTHFEFVDPQTGVRIVEGEFKVTREQVEEYFGSEKYQCSCFAWTSRGHIRSQSATVELAYIKKHFTVAPLSQLVKLGAPVTFRCEAPPAAPFAQQYWLKNGAPAVADDNVQITKEGDLVIKQASLLDMANYTCVAENLAGKRISDPALLTIYVNGGWTPWSTWTDCNCGQTRGAGRRRERTCTAPRPLNGGQPCVGPSMQKTSDCLDCDIDLYVDELADESQDILFTNAGPRSRWSQWSEWSRCDSDCLQSRRRQCLSSILTDCPGKEIQIAQCPMCVRTSKSNIGYGGASYWPLLIALSIAFLVFIVVAVLVIKYMKIKMAESSSYSKPPPGSNYFGSIIKRTLTNQPDLTIHEEFQTIDSRRKQRQMRTPSQLTKQEHLYEVPQLANSYISPIDQEVRASSGRARSACKEESVRSDSSCFLSSGSSYNESVEMSPSLKNHTSLGSKLLTNHQLELSMSKIVNSDGDWLCLSKCGVSLFVPDGVIDKGDELFSIEVNDEEWNRPVLQEGESQLSPIVRCGPKNYHFRKGVILCFPHNACLKNTSWLLSILQKPEDVTSREWRKVLTLGQESPGTPIFAQVDPSKVYIVSEFLSDFVLVGRSFNGLDAKLLKLVLFISRKIDEGYHSLKCIVVDDTPFALYQCIENERRCGNVLLCDPKSINFQENCSDLCFNVRDIGEGWKIHSGGKYQEIPYENIWNMRKYQNCNFIIQQTDSINCLELNLTVYQKQMQSNSVNFNIKTNDLNSNVKRYSSCSLDLGYSVNIVENPFNYSSLSKKEGRYDFVYKNNNFIRTYALESYKTNVLTKSDRVILCKLLDSQTSKGNDWRLLAEKLKMASYYYYFSNTCSPTENILNLWLCRHNDSNMLVNLSRIFREMSRIDCATVVERRCFPN